MRKRIFLLVLAVVCLASCEGLESPKLSFPEPLHYEGEYSNDVVYHSTEVELSVVFFENVYFVAREAAPDSFSGIAPSDTDYWRKLTGYSYTIVRNPDNHNEGRDSRP